MSSPSTSTSVSDPSTEYFQYYCDLPVLTLFFLVLLHFSFGLFVFLTVYVDGHCAACRYGFMMRLGSVILKVESRQVAEEMWYFPLLKPYHDHVPVKADLSDLEEKIRWCRENDDKCREIGQNAKIFYEKYVAKSALLDYVEMCCKQIAKRCVEPPKWYEPPPGAHKPPKLRKPDVPCYEDKATGRGRNCVRCQEEEDAEERALLEEKERLAAERKNKHQTKGNLRARMRKKAAEAAAAGGKGEPPQKKSKI